ncbi:hypothetical protein [Myceligenerans cantabricum]
MVAATVPAEASGAIAVEHEVMTRIAATEQRLTTSFWFSHTSAALLWGAWTWRLDKQVHVIQLHPEATRRGDWLIRHRPRLPERDREVVGGLSVTSRERTIVDCACWLKPQQAAVVVDSLLGAGADRGRVDEIMQTRRRGSRQARAILGVCDGRVESLGESRLRWILVEQGLPVPEVAIRVDTWAGPRWVDVGWPDLKVGLEFDGAIKYSGAFGDPTAILMAEKERHDALVEAGWTILRVTWKDLADPARLLARIRTTSPTLRPTT